MTWRSPGTFSALVVIFFSLAACGSDEPEQIQAEGEVVAEDAATLSGDEFFESEDLATNQSVEDDPFLGSETPPAAAPRPGGSGERLTPEESADRLEAELRRRGELAESVSVAAPVPVYASTPAPATPPASAEPPVVSAPQASPVRVVPLSAEERRLQREMERQRATRLDDLRERVADGPLDSLGAGG